MQQFENTSAKGMLGQLNEIIVSNNLFQINNKIHNPNKEKQREDERKAIDKVKKQKKQRKEEILKKLNKNTRETLNLGSKMVESKNKLYEVNCA